MFWLLILKCRNELYRQQITTAYLAITKSNMEVLAEFESMEDDYEAI